MQQPHMAAQVMSNHPDLQDNMGQIQATGASSSPVASGKASNPQGLAEPLVNDAKEHPAPAPAPQSMQRLAGHEGPKAVVLQESASPASAFGGKRKDLPDALAVQEQHILSGELQGMMAAAEGLLLQRSSTQFIAAVSTAAIHPSHRHRNDSNKFGANLLSSANFVHRLVLTGTRILIGTRI